MASSSKRILFLTCPHLALFKRGFVRDLNEGAITVCGGLEAAGFEVDHFDLNARLNSMGKTDEDWNPQDAYALTTIEGLQALIDGTLRSPCLEKWYEELFSGIDLARYDAVCLSVVRSIPGDDYTRACFSFALYLASRWELPTFLGGSFVIKNLSSDLVMEYLNACQLPHLMVVDGPGHRTFPEILRTTLLNPPLDRRYLRLSGNNLSTHTPKVDVKNAQEVQVDLARDFFHSEVVARYPEVLQIPSFLVIPYTFTSGCKFTCAFCMTAGKEYETLSPVQTVDHLERMAEQGVTNFRFFNTNINMNLKFAIDFANEIIRRGLKIRFSDSCNLRITNREMFAALSEAGCVKLWYGADAIGPQVQASISKRQNVDMMLRTLTNAHEAGIWNAINLIHSFPHETEEDFQMMIDFVRDAREICDAYQVNHFKLMPNIAYQSDPDKFKIRIRRDKTDRYTSDYDEIGGLTWEQKQEQRRHRHLRMDEELTTLQKWFRQNDDLLFGLSHLDLSKARKREIFDFTHYHLSKGNADMSQFSYEPEVSVSQFAELRSTYRRTDQGPHERTTARESRIVATPQTSTSVGLV